MYLPRSRSLNGYQPLVNAADEAMDSKIKRHRLQAAVVLALCFVLFVMVVADTTNVAALQRSHQLLGEATQIVEHTLPTPLSIVDPASGKFINSLENPLYQEMKDLEIMEHRFLRRAEGLPLLQLDKTVMDTLRQSLTLSWTLGTTASDDSLLDNQDILALYCPANSDHGAFQEAATLEQIIATSRQNGGAHDNEWFIPSFSITKYDSCQFRLFDRQDPGSLQLVAVSPTLRLPAAGRSPTNIHLALSNAADEMVIQFHTAEKGTPLAMFGVESPTSKVQGDTHTYSASDLCSEPANVTEVGKFQDPGMIHVVRLTNLEPNTDYVYKVGLASGQGIVWSSVYSFRSPPSHGPDQEPFSYVVYGDQGCPEVGWGPGGEWTSAMAAREHGIRAVHHFGDLAYVRDSFDNVVVFPLDAQFVPHHPPLPSSGHGRGAHLG